MAVLITITMRHPDGSVQVDRCRTLEIAYAIIGELVVYGWTFATLELNQESKV